MILHTPTFPVSVIHSPTRSICIGNNLYVAGIGGSPPAYDQNHTLVWTGFPFVKGDVDPTALEEEMARIPQSASVCIDRGLSP